MIYYLIYDPKKFWINLELYFESNDFSNFYGFFDNFSKFSEFIWIYFDFISI